MDVDIFQAWVQAHDEADRETLAELMDEEFVYEHAGFPEPLDKEEYLHLVEALHLAFPDLELEVQGTTVEDGLVEWGPRLEATHERDLDLTDLGMSFFCSTGHGIDVAGEGARTRVADGSIQAHRVPDPETGIGGLVAQVENGIEALREEARGHDARAPGR
jgi:hypothetical protein